MSLREIEREFRIDRKDIRDWIYNYSKSGLEGLERKEYTQTTYEVRCAAVRDFVEGGMTNRQVSEKYAICRNQLKKLVAKYRSGGYDALKEKRRGRPPKTVSSC